MSKSLITISQSFNKYIPFSKNLIIKDDLEMTLKMNKVLTLDSLIRELQVLLLNLINSSEKSEDRDYYYFLKEQLSNWELSDKFIIEDEES